MSDEVRKAQAQIDAGHYIRHEDIKAWLLSWGTAQELPAPNCICGQDHDDEIRRKLFP